MRGRAPSVFRRSILSYLTSDIYLPYVLCPLISLPAVTRESSRTPHCQLVRPSSATDRSTVSHGCLHRLPFPAGLSRKSQCNRRALVAASLDGNRLLKTCFRVARYVRSAPRRYLTGRGKCT